MGFGSKLLWEICHDLGAWSCVLCEGGLDDDLARRSSLCGTCREALPLMQGPCCSSCGLSLVSEDALCLRCRERPDALDGIVRLRSACLYVGAGQDAMQVAKSREGRALWALWAQLIRPLVAELITPESLILGVPGRVRNVRWRGFDPVRALLLGLGPDYRAQLCLGAFWRRGGSSQKELDRASRLANLRGTIGLRPGLPPGRPVILVDDVCTTGASLSACAALLRQAGAPRVDAVTVFRD